MANDVLDGDRIAILVTDGFEQVELLQPRKALDEAGAETAVVSPKDRVVRGWNFTDWGTEVPVDVKLDDADPEDFDALLPPGGVINPDSLRIQPKAVAFVKGALLAETAKLSTVSDDDYDAVFYPGGHGPLWDLAEDHDERDTGGSEVHSVPLRQRVGPRRRCAWSLPLSRSSRGGGRKAANFVLGIAPPRYGCIWVCLNS
jgi:putative intracellular protease/amidase